MALDVALGDQIARWHGAACALLTPYVQQSDSSVGNSKPGRQRPERKWRKVLLDLMMRAIAVWGWNVSRSSAAARDGPAARRRHLGWARWENVDHLFICIEHCNGLSN